MTATTEAKREELARRMAPSSVIEALSAVMEEVQAVGKTGRNTQQNYNFRGIDAVVNAVGPALRKHGVVVVPVKAEWQDEHFQTKTGTNMRSVTLTVTFRFYGPGGDWIDAQTCGESADAGDKAIPKAHSVAYRTLLLQALCIPTDEPDPDSQSVERAEPPAKREPNPVTTSEKLRKRLLQLASEADGLRGLQTGTDTPVETTWKELQGLCKERQKSLGAMDEDELKELGLALADYVKRHAKPDGISFLDHMTAPI